MKWQEGLKKIKIILKEEPAKRPPRRVYIKGRKVISRVPIERNAVALELARLRGLGIK